MEERLSGSFPEEGSDRMQQFADGTVQYMYCLSVICNMSMFLFMYYL